ncbi:MAG: hypothetical protein IKP73_10700 [Bacteroidales bacterium]|nr:hypothetical protein [Bacteroidales bacterium]
MEEFGTIEMTDAVDATAVATNNTTETAEYAAPEKRISKTAMWAMAHVGFIEEVTDPELRSQLVNYRDVVKRKEIAR